MNNFEILSISSGWITGIMKNNDKEHFFDYSYLTNFLDDLMKALLYVDGNWPQDENVFTFVAQWEPAIDTWFLSRNGARLIVSINTFQNSTREKLLGSAKFEYDYHEFLQIFINGMKDMLRKYGLFGYRSSWGYEFSISLFLKLIDINVGQDLLCLSILKEEENLGVETQISSLNNEFDILKEIK